MSAPTPDWVAAMTTDDIASLPSFARELRVRLARDDIYAALRGVPGHGEAAVICLMEDDDAGLFHHLGIVVAAVRRAAAQARELRGLIGAAP
jgi:hypothetical protein